MLIGLAVYLSGRRWLPVEPKREPGHLVEPRPPLMPGDGKRVLVLIALIPVLAVAWVGNQEIFAAYELWGKAHYQLAFFGWTMPVSFLISIDALVSTLMYIAAIAFWRWYGRRHPEPDEITKCTIGAFIAACAPLLLAFGAAHEAATGEKVGLGWGLGFHVVNDIGFANLYPIGLALYSRAAPKALEATMMAAFLLSLFLAGMIVAKLATLLDVLSGFAFWGLHAALIAGAASVLLIVRGAAGRLLAPTEGSEATP